MQKLLVVILLAVAASWLLSEAQQPDPLGMLAGPRPEVRAPRVLVPPPPVVAPPPARRPTLLERGQAVVRKKGDKGRSKPVSSSSTPSKGMPAWFPKSEIDEEALAKPDASGARVLVGRLSASEDRARQDLRKALDREVADWVAADVPTSWKVPGHVIDAMARETYVQEVTRSLKSLGSEAAPESSTTEVPGLDDLYTLYRAGQKVDFSSTARTSIVELYRRDLAAQRLQKLGGGLALALIGLAVFSGYIKADEATKGYYTNRLRLLAAAGLGVAGVAAYRFLA